MIGGKRARDPNRDSKARQEQGLAKNHLQNARASGAEGHADADFLSAARHVVGEHAIEADARERKGQQSKRARKPRDEPLLIEVAANLFAESDHVQHRQVWIDASKSFANQRLQVLRLSLNVQLNVVNPIGTKFRGLIGFILKFLHLEKRTEVSGPGVITCIFIFGVTNDAYDFVVAAVAGVARAKMFSKRIGIGKILSGEGLVDDHDVE